MEPTNMESQLYNYNEILSVYSGKDTQWEFESLSLNSRFIAATVGKI